jgi:peroxiredoxin
MADALEVGEAAPDVEATLVTPDGDADDVSLSTLVADGPVLLCFYTNDFSPDCVEQWCSFRDYDWFASTDAVRVVGASRSRVATHRRFVRQFDLTYPLFSDRDLELSDAFGVSYRVFGAFRRSRRSTFLVDADRTVRYRWLADHWLDPTREIPPVAEIHEAVRDEVDAEPETFGFA